MTSLLRWLFATPHDARDPAQNELVQWREFRRFRAVMVRGVILIILAQILLAVVIHRNDDSAKRRVQAETRRADRAFARASYQVALLNCRNIEALRATQREQLRRTLLSYQRADVRKLLGPRLTQVGIKQAHERLAELRPLDCPQRASRFRRVPPS